MLYDGGRSQQLASHRQSQPNPPIMHMNNNYLMMGNAGENPSTKQIAIPSSRDAAVLYRKMSLQN
jgi:hypothetical protein